MDPELTPKQARAILALRRRHPGAELHVHEKPWGIIVEIRRDRRTVALSRFDFAPVALGDDVAGDLGLAA